MKTEIERECIGYEYTEVEDSDRKKWSVQTDYLHGKITFSQPHDEDLETAEAFGRAIIKACRDMKKELKKNRLEVK